MLWTMSCLHIILSRCQRQKFGNCEAFCLSNSVQAHPLDPTITCNSYALNYRELGTLLTLNESSAEGALEPLTIASMHYHPATELS